MKAAFIFKFWFTSPVSCQWQGAKKGEKAANKWNWQETAGGPPWYKLFCQIWKLNPTVERMHKAKPKEKSWHQQNVNSNVWWTNVRFPPCVPSNNPHIFICVKYWSFDYVAGCSCFILIIFPDIYTIQKGYISHWKYCAQSLVPLCLLGIPSY